MRKLEIDCIYVFQGAVTFDCTTRVRTALEYLVLVDTLFHFFPLLMQVNWNPNCGAHFWLASGYNCGLVRLHCMASLDNPSLKSYTYKKLQEVINSCPGVNQSRYGANNGTLNISTVDKSVSSDCAMNEVSVDNSKMSTPQVNHSSEELLTSSAEGSNFDVRNPCGIPDCNIKSEPLDS